MVILLDSITRLARAYNTQVPSSGKEGSVLSADLKMRIGIITTTVDEICAISVTFNLPFDVKVMYSVPPTSNLIVSSNF